MGGRRFPWAISITHKGQNRLGGMIISPFHILTAAHGFTKFFFRTNGGWAPEKGEPCQFNGFRHVESRLIAFGDDCIRISNPQDFQPAFTYDYFRLRNGSRITRRHLRVNSDQSITTRNTAFCNESNVQFNKIRAVFLDDGFVRGGCLEGHDWAIVEVQEEMRFTHPSIRPICLPSLFEQKFNNDPRLLIVGWGKPNAFANGSPLIREIPMLHDPKCTPPWSDAMPTKVADYLCAKAINQRDDESPRTCHGDSGSGMEIRDARGRALIIGITSFGSPMCPPNELARFTRVSNYLRPICEITELCYSIDSNEN